MPITIAVVLDLFSVMFCPLEFIKD
jgi:hypothetical protein